jgi:hypothetical protein
MGRAPRRPASAALMTSDVSRKYPPLISALLRILAQAILRRIIKELNAAGFGKRPCLYNNAWNTRVAAAATC